MVPLRSPVPAALVLVAFALWAGPASAQDGDGSPGAAVVGGLLGGAVGLWSFYPISGCPMITIGAAREADACDAGGVAAGLGGLVGGAWTGASDSGAGYGLALGAVAGFGAGWLLGRVVDTPRWVSATVLVAATVAGGLLGASDDEPRPQASGMATRILLGTLPVR